MNAVVRNGSSPKLIENIKNISISQDVPGIVVEVDNYKEIFVELDKGGFKPSLQGKLINFEITGITIFE